MEVTHAFNVKGPNLRCFIDRVASHPERLKYIYFNTILMLRAVARLAPVLESYDYCSSGNKLDDEHTLDYINKITSIAKDAGKFDESVLFRGENANVGGLVNWETLQADFNSRFYVKSSRPTSVTLPASWTVWAATNADSGARSRLPASQQP